MRPMTDEHFMRQWTEGHERFSSDLDQGLARLRRIIGTAYGVSIEPSARESDTHARSMLAGLGAAVVTVALFISTVLVTTGGASLA